MTINEYKNQIWNHYLYIEKEFIDTQTFVSLNEKNYATFSDKYFSLLQLIGSEIDVILKEICNCYPLPTGNSLKNIHQYCEVVTRNITNFSNEEIWVFGLEKKIKPWDNWSFTTTPVTTSTGSTYNRYSGIVPFWWTNYNKTKHTRMSVVSGDPIYERANLKNVLNGLAALYLCDLMLLTEIIKVAKTNGTYSDGLFAIKPSKLFESETINNNHTATFMQKQNSLNGIIIPFTAF